MGNSGSKAKKKCKTQVTSDFATDTVDNISAVIDNRAAVDTDKQRQGVNAWDIYGGNTRPGAYPNLNFKDKKSKDFQRKGPRLELGTGWKWATATRCQKSFCAAGAFAGPSNMNCPDKFPKDGYDALRKSCPPGYSMPPEATDSVLQSYVYPYEGCLFQDAPNWELGKTQMLRKCPWAKKGVCLKDKFDPKKPEDAADIVRCCYLKHNDGGFMEGTLLSWKSPTLEKGISCPPCVTQSLPLQNCEECKTALTTVCSTADIHKIAKMDPRMLDRCRVWAMKNQAVPALNEQTKRFMEGYCNRKLSTTTLFDSSSGKRPQMLPEKSQGATSFDRMRPVDQDACGCILLPKKALEKAETGVDPRCEKYLTCRAGRSFWPTAVPFNSTNRYCPNVCKAVLKCEQKDSEAGGDITCDIRDSKVVADCKSGAKINYSKSDPHSDATDITTGDTDEKPNDDDDDSVGGLLGLLGVKDKEDVRDKVRDKVDEAKEYVKDKSNRGVVFGVVGGVVLLAVLIIAMLLFFRRNTGNAPASPAALSALKLLAGKNII